jgi:hypothetical protein
MLLDELLDGVSLGTNRGRSPELELYVVRELGEADLPLVLNPPKGLSTLPSPIQMRERHHSAARLIAEGRSMAEVGAITGYSPSRISILKQSPDFQELVQVYKAQKDALFLDVHGRKATLAATAISVLQDRLEDTPNSISTRELTEILKVSAGEDAGPQKAAPVSVAINFVSPPPTHTTEPKTIDGSLANDS